MSSHQSPQEIRKSLKHPVIDGDGHWVEYTPVFAEKIRKVTGDLGGNGFLAVAAAHPGFAGARPSSSAPRRASRWKGSGAGKRPTRATARPR